MPRIARQFVFALTLFLTALTLLVQSGRHESVSAQNQLMPKTEPGYKVENLNLPGINTIVVTTPDGRVITFNTPNDVYAGETFSGTAQTKSLNDPKLDLSKTSFTVGDRDFEALVGGKQLLITRNHWIEIFDDQRPVVVTPIPTLNGLPPPPPGNAVLPTGGQMGNNIIIPAPCDGIFAPTDFASIGGTKLESLAESRRMKVFQNTSQVAGPTEIQFNEQGKLVTGQFHNLGVRLSGNTNLLRGQKGPLNLVIFGLQKIDQFVPVDFENKSPGVVGISGGDLQHFDISPNAVNANGEWTRSFTMTGRSAGVFNITATVRWKNPVVEQIPQCTSDAHRCGEGLKYWCTSDDKPCQPPQPPLPPTGERPSPSPFTPTEAPTPSPSPHHTPTGTPTPPPPRTCVLTSVLEPGPAIDGNAFAPTSDAETKSNESIPLFVTASDVDQVIQTCSCPPGSQSKKIDIVDSVKFAWIKEGSGKLEAGGPASLYIPPDIPVGGKASAVVRATITDSGENGKDSPKHAVFTITVEREEECKYKRHVTIEKDFGGGQPVKPPPGENECQPDKERWDAVPPLTAEADTTVKLCAGERAVIRASGSDTDLLTLKCVSRNCGSPIKDLLLADELKYTWNVSGSGSPGAFLIPSGANATTTTTYGRNTSVIYDAPETPGNYTIALDIGNNDKPAPDAKIHKTIKVKVYKVLLQVTGLSKEEKECKGVTVPLDGLTKVTLFKYPAEGTMTLKINSGASKIKVWEDDQRTKQPVSLTFDASEPKDLWIEGVEPSDNPNDVELVLEGSDAPCKDKITLTVVKNACRVKLILDSVKYYDFGRASNSPSEQADNIGENWKFQILVNGQTTNIPEHKLAYGATNVYNKVVWEGTPFDQTFYYNAGKLVQCNQRNADSIFFFTITATEIARALGKDSSGSSKNQRDFTYDCIGQESGDKTRHTIEVWIAEKSALLLKDLSGNRATLGFTFRIEAGCGQK